MGKIQSLSPFRREVWREVFQICSSELYSPGRLEVARQLLQVGGAAQRTGSATQTKPASAG